MRRDWHEWYAAYDDPSSSLSRRLSEVRRQLVPLLERAPRQVVSMCAGDGRDLLPMLRRRSPATRALLVELDPVLAARARAAAHDGGLEGVVVRTADAGTTDSYLDGIPADLLLACGVFGNIGDDDLTRTVGRLSSLLAPGAHVVWTRGAELPPGSAHHGRDPADHVRALFTAGGFEEVVFVRPADARYRVGVHRLVADPAPYEPSVRLFDFV